jgi:hypothetical protein
MCAPCLLTETVTSASGFGKQMLGAPEREVGQFVATSLKEQGFAMEKT